MEEEKYDELAFLDTHLIKLNDVFFLWTNISFIDPIILLQQNCVGLDTRCIIYIYIYIYTYIYIYIYIYVRIARVAVERRMIPH